jgi:hypothetical protein
LKNFEPITCRIIGRAGLRLELREPTETATPGARDETFGQGRDSLELPYEPEDLDALFANLGRDFGSRRRRAAIV